MSLRKSYSKMMRNELGVHPVWEPGTKIMLGDYGIFLEGSFKKLGQLKDLLSDQDAAWR